MNDISNDSLVPAQRMLNFTKGKNPLTVTEQNLQIGRLLAYVFFALIFVIIIVYLLVKRLRITYCQNHSSNSQVNSHSGTTICTSDQSTTDDDCTDSMLGSIDRILHDDDSLSDIDDNTGRDDQSDIVNISDVEDNPIHLYDDKPPDYEKPPDYDSLVHHC